MLALFAGQGGLPGAVLARLPEPPLVFSLSDFLPDGLDPDLTFRIEHLGSVLGELKARGVTDVCFAGAVSRPPIDPAQIDPATFPLVPVLQQAMASGDDGALRGVIAVFEQAGFAVRGVDDIAPDLLPAPGVLTGTPGDGHRRDAARGAAIVAAMGAADIGQACAVHRGQAIAVEGIFGTDWMLDTLSARPDDGGGLLFKAPKPAQDRRMDLPTVGPATVAAVARAGLDGIVIAAGGVIVLDQAAVIAACDEAGLFFWVHDPRTNG
ncbi:MAG: UDP-2,3-diacylglucosamine diphosphatase LpxI [Marinibacterium sp.]|nr:UDP-2,3-diacylglucosamine diphosphatase LpxI [Marinibacterium sp.]